jgi:L-ascorbate metabolism protein UlaG (beta-lactamase superfamily)
MEIKWKGQSCFEIKTKNNVIITDPYGDIGLGVLKLKGNIVTISHDHDDHSNKAAVAALSEGVSQVIISDPGEYEVGGVLINGVTIPHDKEEGKDRGFCTAYTITAEEITVCHLGDCGAALTAEQLEALNGVDILFIPIGGTYTLDAEEAVKVVNQIEPRIVIPMHYGLPGLKYDLVGVEKFVKEIGLPPQELDVLKIQKSGLPAEEMQLIILKKS